VGIELVGRQLGGDALQACALLVQAIPGDDHVVTQHPDPGQVRFEIALMALGLPAECPFCLRQPRTSAKCL